MNGLWKEVSVGFTPASQRIAHKVRSALGDVALMGEWRRSFAVFDSAAGRATYGVTVGFHAHVPVQEAPAE